ncbi:MAG: 2-oxoacid:acceptor oxidoreductase family protein, partial [Bacteroidales bacterium]
MKIDIILAGVGGQGILSIAAVIGEAALSQGLYMKQSEVHGMSQRGGDVQSNLRISDQAIHSDLIPTGKADLVLALEPMEALRY